MNRSDNDGTHSRGIAPLDKGKRRQPDGEEEEYMTARQYKLDQSTDDEDEEEMFSNVPPPPQRKKAKRSASHDAADSKGPSALQRLLDAQGSSSSCFDHPNGTNKKKGQTKRRQRAVSSTTRTQAEKDEDDEIQWLEAMLRMDGEKKRGKGKGKGNGNDADEAVQEEDGYDELLEDLDRFYPGMYEDGEGEGSDDDDGEEDEEGEDDSGSEEEEDDDDDDDDSQGSESVVGSASSLASEEEAGSDLESDDDSAPHAPKINPYGAALPTSTAPGSGRYLPPAARAAAVAASSSSPSATSSDPSHQKLHRQLQGLLNRLGDANVDSIVSSLEAIYREHGRRAEVSHALARIIIETIASRTSNVLLTDTFVVVHAALVGALYRVVGVEFVAGFVQEMVSDLRRHYEEARKSTITAATSAEGEEDEQEQEQERSRELTNLVSLAAHLYNLQVIACPLIYDLVRLFLGAGGDVDASTRSGDSVEIKTGREREGERPLSEVDVECLLKMVKTCGPQLRMDDSASLREIVALAQRRSTTTSSASSSSSRTRFMLETLSDISSKSSSSSSKRQRQQQHQQQNESPTAHLLSNMKKYLGAMDKKRTLRSYGEPLRVGLKDLQEAETRGKWWLVGAAWKDEDQFQGAGADAGSGAVGIGQALGVESVTTKRSLTSAVQGNAAGQNGDDDDDDAQATLLALARRHGMNTPSRRLVFTTLMDPSSLSPQETAERLLSLRLPSSTSTGSSSKGSSSSSSALRRETVRVLLHCLGREREYNPYYALVGARLAELDAGTRVTMQFCLWDYLRGELGEKRVGGRSVVGDEEDEDEGDFDNPDDEGEGEGRGEGGGVVARTKLHHLARAYGWWLSRGSLSLNVLRTVPFTSLRPQGRGRDFLRLVLVHTLLATQTRNPATLKGSKVADRTAIEDVLRRGVGGNDELRRGLHFFVVAEMSEERVRGIVGGEGELVERALWACEVAREVLGSSSSALSG
ncbi:hypothetical protein BDZ90DRAFT_232261 [Jaminaea rosea]|uniref:MI domain-containing protein n=1 Tax=Jaminaea rosea TaxID=1569628 RepID=A0A316UR65_9BASI|nr:hypothetical protein BDZ90DRAFT_232261 [Jaminaea rosea]PWN27278.1 hypothetical protein BDZ90DRAFT_232261 [Jaminaea rosea]